jgi:hypothetical protein
MSTLARVARVVVSSSLGLSTAVGLPGLASAGGIRVGGGLGGTLSAAPDTTFFDAGPGATIDLGAASGTICTLSRVQGALESESSFAWVSVINGRWVLRTGVATAGSAMCVNAGAFSGPGTNVLATTNFAAPWWADVLGWSGQPNTATITMTTSAVNAPPQSTWCMLSGVGGGWQGPAESTSAFIQNPGQHGQAWGPWTLEVKAQAEFSETLAAANCFAFPNRASVAQTGLVIKGYNGRTLALPNAATAFCGLQGIEGKFDFPQYSDDYVSITADPYGNQIASLGGNVVGADIACVNYAQP